jgi:signal peptidase I
MTIGLYICIAFSLAFSALSFSPAFDVSFLAFPLAVLATGGLAVVAVRFLKTPERSRLGMLRKTLEYLPFALFAAFVIRRAGSGDCSFTIDLLTVICWLAVTGLTLWCLFKLSDKRVERLFPSVGPAVAAKRGFAGQVVEWADALLQAACLVLIINLFIFQLYAIPSESMVPEFMIGDRVVVIKTPSGPKFPLSTVGVPRMRTYERGDIVVFNNPHYDDTKEARVKTFASQLIYMLTFTGVNINRDEFGEERADPLVKRVTGVPGEKLMLVDGVLYSRKKGDADFAPVTDDATWACWNVSALPRSELSQVKAVPLSKEYFTLLESIESMRANLDLGEAASESRALADRFSSLKKLPDTAADSGSLLPGNRREVYSYFNADADIARLLYTTNGGISWFKGFMTDWIDIPARKNLFENMSFRLDVMLKLSFGRLIVRDAELFAANATATAFTEDETRRALHEDSEKLLFYLNPQVHDMRNMGEFPSGADEYIPENCFFMMGDNRFNSLDMRHSYDMHLEPVDDADPYSFLYRSNLEPQYVGASKILGTANFRFWPPSRIGVPK